jgi:hypothetical protein
LLQLLQLLLLLLQLLLMLPQLLYGRDEGFQTLVRLDGQVDGVVVGRR